MRTDPPSAANAPTAKRGFPSVLLSLLLLLVFAAPLAAEEPTASAEQAIEAGRDALDKGWLARLHNWYDEDRDDVRRINIEIPQPPWDWSWGNWDFSWLKHALDASGWLLGGLFILALVTLLTLAYLKRDRDAPRASEEEQGEEPTSDIDRVEALPFRMSRQTTDPLTEARRAYEAENYDEAIVFLFSHQLIELDRRQIIRLARGKTNRQLVGEIAPRRALEKLVESTMVACEDVFFGGHPLTRARFEACWLRQDEFQRLVQEEHR